MQFRDEAIFRVGDPVILVDRKVAAVKQVKIPPEVPPQEASRSDLRPPVREDPKSSRCRFRPAS